MHRAAAESAIRALSPLRSWVDKSACRLARTSRVNNFAVPAAWSRGSGPAARGSGWAYSFNCKQRAESFCDLACTKWRHYNYVFYGRHANAWQMLSQFIAGERWRLGHNVNGGPIGTRVGLSDGTYVDPLRRPHPSPLVARQTWSEQRFVASYFQRVRGWMSEHRPSHLTVWHQRSVLVIELFFRWLALIREPRRSAVYLLRA
jgi:hypothetical protein